MAQGHTRRTVSGVNWNLLRVSVQTGLGLFVGIVLARLLPPEDFGLLATAMIFIGLAETVGTLGMGAAVIQRRDLSDRLRGTAATLSLLMGLLLALGVVAIAPWLARLFDSPEVTPVVRVLAVNLFFAAMGAVPGAMVMRRMDFRLLFFIELGAYLAGYAGLSLLLASLGYGVWSLVWGAVLSITLSNVLVLLVEPVAFRLRLSRSDVRSLLHFGGGISLNRVINYFAANVDYLAIGKLLNQNALGLYSRAYHLVTLPLNKIATTLTSVMFPAYAEIQADPQRIRQVYYRVIQVVALLLFPVLLSFCVAAEHVIGGLFGANWLGAAAAFRILALAGMLKGIFHLAGPVVQATGHVYPEIRRQLVYLALLILGCFAVAGQGIEAVAWVVVGASLWLYLAMGQLALKILGGSWRTFFARQLPGMWLGAVVVAADLLIMTWLRPYQLPHELMLLAVILASAVSYVLGFLYLPAAMMGEAPAWLVHKYAARLPRPIGRWLVDRRPMAETVAVPSAGLVRP